MTPLLQLIIVISTLGLSFGAASKNGYRILPDQVPPVLNETLTSSQKDFEDFQYQGSKIELRCVASSDLPMMYHWIKDGHELTGSSDSRLRMLNGKLQISRLNYAVDDGIYQCLVSNEAGSVISEFIQLKTTVFGDFLPGHQRRDDTRYVNATIGKPLRIPCPPMTHSYPKLYGWSSVSSSGVPYLTESIHDHPRLRVLPDGSLNYAFVTDEDVDDINQRTNGIRCTVFIDKQFRVSNGFKLIRRQGTVVNFAPEFMEQLSGSVSVPKGGSTTLVCTANGRPAPTINWFQDGGLIESSNERFELMHQRMALHIQSAQQAHAGEYSCIASNEAEGKTNEIKSSTVISVHEKPTWVVFPRNKWVRPGSTVKLVCSARGNPQPVVRWKQFGVPVVAGKYLFADGGLLELRNLPLGLYNFECSASNQHGKIVKKLKIVSSDEPVNVDTFISKMKQSTITTSNSIRMNACILLSFIITNFSIGFINL